MPSLAPGYRLAETGGVKNHRLIFLAATACIFFFLPGCSRSKPKVDFTGSDWCGWCKRLEQEILSQSQFENYARENLVLLEVDFPRAKSQSPELRKQNQELAQQYQIEGFPTIVVLNGDGQKLWQYDGYFPDGLAAFIAQLEKLRKG